MGRSVTEEKKYRRKMVMVCILITETGGCRTEEAQVIHVEQVCFSCIYACMKNGPYKAACAI